jgi:hypothetical protein
MLYHLLNSGGKPKDTTMTLKDLGDGVGTFEDPWGSPVF